MVSTLRCGRSNPGSNPGHGKFFWVPLKLSSTLPPLLTPSFRPLFFLLHGASSTCSGCLSELPLGPSLRARALRFEPSEKRLKTKRSHLVWKNLASETTWCWYLIARCQYTRWLLPRVQWTCYLLQTTPPLKQVYNNEKSAASPQH